MGQLGLPRAASALDRVLLQQKYAAEPLLPTPTNVNPVHVPGEDLLFLIAVQQWVHSSMGIKLPLLDGVFVLVPSAQLPACAEQAAAIPWRLRQVLAVEAAPGVDPADATVVLVGGQRLRAGAVKEGQLSEAPDYQYLCCELAALQLSRQLCQLQVFDAAHMSWRLQTGCELGDMRQAHEQSCAEVPSCETPAVRDLQQQVSEILKRLPDPDWADAQVLPWLELNPILYPDSPDQPWTLLDADEHSHLLQGAADAWVHFVQHKLAGQQPQPATDWVPWLPIEHHHMQGGAAAPEAPAAASLQDQPPAQQLDTEPPLPPWEQQQQQQGRSDTGHQHSAAHVSHAAGGTARPAAGVDLAGVAAAAVLGAAGDCSPVVGSVTPGAAQSPPARGAAATPADRQQQQQQQQPTNLPLLDAATSAKAKQQQSHQQHSVSQKKPQQQNSGSQQGGEPPTPPQPAQQQQQQQACVSQLTPLPSSPPRAAAAHQADPQQQGQTVQPSNCLPQSRRWQQKQQEQQPGHAPPQLQQLKDKQQQQHQLKEKQQQQQQQQQQQRSPQSAGKQQQQQQPADKRPPSPQKAVQQQDREQAHAQPSKRHVGEQQRQQQYWARKLQALPSSVRQPAAQWLQRLAVILRETQRTRDMSVAVVKRQNPFPDSVMRHFNGVPRAALLHLPGLSWQESDNMVRLDSELQQVLLRDGAECLLGLDKGGAALGGDGNGRREAAAQGPRASSPRQQQQQQQQQQEQQQQQQQQKQKQQPDAAEVEDGELPGMGTGSGKASSSKEAPAAAADTQQSKQAPAAGGAAAAAAAAAGSTTAAAAGGGVRAEAAASRSARRPAKDMGTEKKLHADGAPPAAAAAAAPDPPAAAKAVAEHAEPWLEKLAVLLGPPEEDRPLPTIHLSHLAQELPLPTAVLAQYGSAKAFIRDYPGIKWGQQHNEVCLHPSLHVKLLRQAANRQQQQGRKRGRADDGEGSLQQHKSARSETPAASAEHVQHAAYSWLRQLAGRLELDGEVTLSVLRRDLPVPSSVVGQYGTASKFFKSVRGLQWRHGKGTIGLEVSLHRQLLAAGSAAQHGALVPEGAVPLLCVGMPSWLHFE